jgi:protein MpaA
MKPSFKNYFTSIPLALLLSTLSAGMSAGARASEGPARFAPATPEVMNKWCSELKPEIKRLKWTIDPCIDGVQWKYGGASNEGRSLVYAEFGNAQASNVTLILTMVHGDEITPLYIGLEVIHWLKVHESELKDSRVIVAPLVNPDGFYRAPKTRMNAHGVDVNRNFATKDWEAGAKKWKTAFRSDPRRFPGSAPRSEPETIFQEELIRVFTPQKIMSVHSPLNHMDYDGPSALSLNKFPREYVHECVRLQRELKAKSTGYFPGSLGNYAGRELGIPTITLELPTADGTKAEVYWNKFSQGIHNMIQFTMPKVVFEMMAPPAPVKVSSTQP